MATVAERIFNQLGKRYEDAYAESPDLCEIVKGTLDMLKPHSRVLDVGCGTGKPVAEILASGDHEVYGIDVAEEMVKIARNQVPGSFEKCDMRKYTPPCPFDGIFAVFSLFMLCPSDTHAMVFRFAEWLQEGGFLVLGTVPSTSSSFDSGKGKYDEVWDCLRVSGNWMNFVAQDTYLSETGWQQLLKQAGFTIEAERAFKFIPKDKGYNMKETHYFIVARKTVSSPLFGPYPLPTAYTGPRTLHQVTWKSLQDRLIIEQGRDMVLDHIKNSRRVLDVGDTLKSFAKGSPMSNNMAIQVHSTMSEDLPFPDRQFDTVLSMFTLDYVHDLYKALQEAVRVADASSSQARIVVIQGAPSNEILRLINTICVPQSAVNPKTSHQGYLLYSTKRFLSEMGFGNISIYEVDSHYYFDEQDPVGLAAEATAGLWHHGDSNYALITEALLPKIQALFTDHPGVLKNGLVTLVARPTLT